MLLVNAPLAGGEHDLTDVTFSILDHYGLPSVDGMLGESFLRADAPTELSRAEAPHRAEP